MPRQRNFGTNAFGEGIHASTRDMRPSLPDSRHDPIYGGDGRRSAPQTPLGALHEAAEEFVQEHPRELEKAKELVEKITKTLEAMVLKFLTRQGLMQLAKVLGLTFLGKKFGTGVAITLNVLSGTDAQAPAPPPAAPFGPSPPPAKRDPSDPMEKFKQDVSDRFKEAKPGDYGKDFGKGYSNTA
jgi:hypothetical protein